MWPDAQLDTGCVSKRPTTLHAVAEMQQLYVFVDSLQLVSQQLAHYPRSGLGLLAFHARTFPVQAITLERAEISEAQVLDLCFYVDVRATIELALRELECEIYSSTLAANSKRTALYFLSS